ncbi:MAG: 2-oxoglutarate dehydrogenase complex dihydrolipoyllysine-residue succinyltransferase [Rhodospirillaceae bacterium]|mgnify:CR=1 FL=1|jgi:2-oxoglutarate dehydrogenase E2 component (dihydrolipoamide succinyltransferase)|nr:2-oxoglutarate dehydrogenase complex dihydrolipoyllysine-residue succinyltransferase [Rhodospirillaceae bacterium]MBT5374562.1 2-oxoglutarate dehydrogenase complex dihydrolipoyllysine-residue succinyltransferase [Rhodospirillaceae bacterium]MBT5753231.1 2-oxoglutarate dehydrogenase complex dihydrolipoyllysine-residue succinyltransferase [Rhodospirillaceae bacterium]
MATEIKVPTLGESVTEATVSEWMKAVGDTVEVDETILSLDTDKVSLEVYAPAAGVLSEIRAEAGSEVLVGGILGIIDSDAVSSGGGPAPTNEETKAAPIMPAAPPAPIQTATQTATGKAANAAPLSPSVRKLVIERGLDPDQIPASGRDGRLTKGDVLAYLENAPAPSAPPQAMSPVATPAAPPPGKPAHSGDQEERVKMTRLRKRVAERLKEAQNTAAMLTTFNEVDMTNVIEARNRHKDAFEKKHGVKLGFMSFFAKACITALKEIPAVNAEIDGDELVYKNYYNLSIAVGSPKGLVVPVLRNADQLGFAGIEKAIGAFAAKARDGNLTMEDLSGGTFTISNGGIYGSMMSTPILNPPQSGILGMHRTMPRPVAIGDKVEIRPMMYLALSYDHRIIDGREAVTFLIRVKECIEDPQRILLDM